MIIPFIFSLVITSLLTPIFIFINKKIGLVDDPKLHKHPGMIHTKPIPRGGGAPLFLGTFITGFIFIPHTNQMIALALAGTIALIIGLIDDALNAKGKDISPYLRFIMNIVVAIIVVSSGIR